MGMECAAIRSSSPVAFVRPWLNNAQRFQQSVDDRPTADDQHEQTDGLFPHSAPSSLFCSSPLGFCRRAASFPLASAALQAAEVAAVPRPSTLLIGPSLKVRSQSESAALNKLTQLSISHMPRSMLLDQLHCRFQPHYRMGQNGDQTGGQSTTSGFGTGYPIGKREVKFFAQQQLLQSDSEGEDSLVSSPDEVSPSNSCNEEEADEDEDQFQRHNESSLLTDADNFEEDLGLGPMDEEIERDRDRLAARLSSQHDSKTARPHSPSAIADNCPLEATTATASACDYVTVPRLLSSLDVATSAPPTPMVHLPLQLPLASIDLPICTPDKLPNVPEEPETKEEEDEVIPLQRACKKLRKCVRFADDCGKCLETVRVMTEPSDYPPKINPAVLRRFRRAAALAMRNEGGGCNGGTNSPPSEDDELSDDANETKQQRSTWKLAFRQPASEYVKFRETLDNQKVALENVMLRNEQGRMVGTIKVSNIAFEKQVFIRYSADGWRTFTDKPAQYQSSPSKTFDTFRFDIEVPRNENEDARLEFCVCFKAGSTQYWDSNGGRNYALVSPEPPVDFGGQTASPRATAQSQQPKTVSATNVERSQPRAIVSRLDRDDPYRMEWNSPTSGWNSTSFASWRQLSTDGPYWSCTPPLPDIRDNIRRTEL